MSELQPNPLGLKRKRRGVRVEDLEPAEQSFTPTELETLQCSGIVHGQGVIVTQLQHIWALVKLGCYGKGMFSRSVPSHGCIPSHNQMKHVSRKRRATDIDSEEMERLWKKRMKLHSQWKGANSIGKEEGVSSVGEEEGMTSVGEEEGVSNIREEEGMASVGEEEGVTSIGKEEGVSSVGEEEGMTSVGEEEGVSNIREEEGMASVGEEEGVTSIREEEDNIIEEEGMTSVGEEEDNIIEEEGMTSVGEEEGVSNIVEEESINIGEEEDATSVREEEGMTDIREKEGVTSVGGTIIKEEKGATSIGVTSIRDMIGGTTSTEEAEDEGGGIRSTTGQVLLGEGITSVVKEDTGATMLEGMNIVAEETMGECTPIVEDTSAEEQEYQNFVSRLKAIKQDDPYPIEEYLQLSAEEAFYLAAEVGVLTVERGEAGTLTNSDLWLLFTQLIRSFCARYAAYSHYRAGNWVPKSGLKFGVDFLLYKESPLSYHSSFSVVVQEEGVRSPGEKHTHLTWKEVIALNRVCESAKKDLLVCHVTWSEGITLTEPCCIDKATVTDTLIKWWVPERDR